MAQRFVAGVDGCPGGWLVVLRPIDDAAQAQAQLVSKFSDVLGVQPAPAIIGVDMPIGLPDVSGVGGRRADIEARANLGARQSAVFAVPSRTAVMQPVYSEACAVAMRTSVPPRKVSKQCFNLFLRIREIDALMTPAVQARVYETHPELGFWALNGERPLGEPKKMKSRPHPAGLELRRDLLSAAGYSRRFLEDMSAFPARHAGADDLLDAAACAWSAARIVNGTAQRFPKVPPLDSKGLRMEIWG